MPGGRSANWQALADVLVTWVLRSLVATSGKQMDATDVLRGFDNPLPLLEQLRSAPTALCSHQKLAAWTTSLKPVIGDRNKGAHNYKPLTQLDEGIALRFVDESLPLVAHTLVVVEESRSCASGYRNTVVRYNGFRPTPYERRTDRLLEEDAPLLHASDGYHHLSPWVEVERQTRSLAGVVPGPRQDRQEITGLLWMAGLHRDKSGEGFRALEEVVQWQRRPTVDVDLSEPTQGAIDTLLQRALKEAGFALSSEVQPRSGSFGMVVQASRSEHPGHRFAVKILRDDLQIDQNAVEQSAERLRRLASSAGVVRYHPELFRLKHAPRWIVMEWVDGEPLDGWLRRRPSLEDREKLAREIVTAVVGLHRVGVVHRDIAPPNIMVRRDGRPVIVDLGLARLAASGGRSASTATRTGIGLGRHPYVAPEQSRGELTRDARVDVHALAFVVLALLVGKEVDSWEDASARIGSHPWRSVLERARSEPNERPRDARGLLDELLLASTARHAAHAHGWPVLGGTRWRHRKDLQSVRAPDPYGSVDAWAILHESDTLTEEGVAAWTAVSSVCRQVQPVFAVRLPVVVVAAPPRSYRPLHEVYAEQPRPVRSHMRTVADLAELILALDASPVPMDVRSEDLACCTLSGRACAVRLKVATRSGREARRALRDVLEREAVLEEQRYATEEPGTALEFRRDPTSTIEKIWASVQAPETSSHAQALCVRLRYLCDGEPLRTLDEATEDAAKRRSQKWQEAYKRRDKRRRAEHAKREEGRRREHDIREEERRREHAVREETRRREYLSREAARREEAHAKGEPFVAEDFVPEEFRAEPFSPEPYAPESRDVEEREGEIKIRWQPRKSSSSTLVSAGPHSQRRREADGVPAELRGWLERRGDWDGRDRSITMALARRGMVELACIGSTLDGIQTSLDEARRRGCPWRPWPDAWVATWEASSWRPLKQVRSRALAWLELARDRVGEYGQPLGDTSETEVDSLVEEIARIVLGGLDSCAVEAERGDAAAAVARWIATDETVRLDPQLFPVRSSEAPPTPRRGGVLDLDTGRPVDIKTEGDRWCLSVSPMMAERSPHGGEE
ncbi:MAG: hypothetical protein OHK0013_01710 [Sandaracinaceae bacterium]